MKFTDRLPVVVQILVTLSFVLLGVSFVFEGNLRGIEHLLQFYQLDNSLTLSLASYVVGATFLFAALLVASPRVFVKPLLSATVLLVLALVPLLTLASPSRWMMDLGGFPIIGSGQGIIKYYALLPLAVFLFYRNTLSLRAHALFNASSIAMVLFWIGSMKFFEFEAQGIVSLLETSPFLSWMYALFTVQGASNAIGVYDLFFAVLLLFGLMANKPVIALVGLVGASAVFFVTQSFLITVPGALSSSSLLSGTGQFLIKDLWFIANSLVVLIYTQLPRDQNVRGNLNIV
ncbi:protein of unknown function DUF417 [Pseudoalteromonas luteoviolacea B = ATCC 29581]|nr:protein of unknown function DUF417 [Pseudoalteromonas luteoviolacea B = ATCC 29581]